MIGRIKERLVLIAQFEKGFDRDANRVISVHKVALRRVHLFADSADSKQTKGPGALT